MTDTLGGTGWNVPKTKVFDGETYHVHGEKGRAHNPYGYSEKAPAENAAKRLRAAGYSVRASKVQNFVVLYKRKN